ncbi:hypothetical protein GIB67_042486 [Kingdonia uniflora]|uniref:Uncharacterized protein n=1 Tax=Kingdonia uniflora TaxID=39325 RepID=A0A7J7M0Z9_9MAGN|nr:hypothetical protein GIB67_042486 [Kingdonia uniflora]
MQRQSLSGSPVSKHHSHGPGPKERNNEEEEEEEQVSTIKVRDDDEIKTEKLHHRSSRAEKSIHLVPIITIFCVLVLYLYSYDPPQQDLENFKGFRRTSNQIDLRENGDLERYLTMEKNDVLAIANHRSLQEVGKHARIRRVHRKLGDF